MLLFEIMTPFHSETRSRISPEEIALPTPTKNPLLSKNAIGSRIRAARLERGLSQIELAKALNSHQSALSQIEVGRRGVSLNQILRLCKALKVSPEAILGESEHQGAAPQLRQSRVRRRLERIETLPPAKHRALLQMIDAFIDKHGRQSATAA